MKTRSKLLSWGAIQDDACIMCASGHETENHLFHDFPFASIIWRGLLLKMGYVKELESTWDEVVHWCVGAFKVRLVWKSLRNLFSMLIFLPLME